MMRKRSWLARHLTWLPTPWGQVSPWTVYPGGAGGALTTLPVLAVPPRIRQRSTRARIAAREELNSTELEDLQEMLPGRLGAVLTLGTLHFCPDTPAVRELVAYVQTRDKELGHGVPLRIHRDEDAALRFVDRHRRTERKPPASRAARVLHASRRLKPQAVRGSLLLDGRRERMHAVQRAVYDDRHRLSLQCVVPLHAGLL